MKTIRVLLAEDHRVIRTSLRYFLERARDIQVVGEAGNGAEAVEKAQQLQPDVVLMDITMPRLNGINAARQIMGLCPETKVVMLTMHKGEAQVQESQAAGASAYVPKTAQHEELVSAIRSVAKGDSWWPPSLGAKALVANGETSGLAGPGPFGVLTNREREVLQLIAAGYSNPAIAEQLHVSVHTVDTHRAHIMDKLDIHKATELTRYAMKLGLID